MDEQEAVQNDTLPEGVQANEPVPAEDHTAENEQVKDQLAKYGETDVEQFVAKVQSNSIFARKVVRHLLGLDADVPLNFATTSGAPQEHNLTGKLQHTEFPPKIVDSLPHQDADVAA